MDELKELIDKAKVSNNGLAEESRGWVEFNGGVPVYGIDEKECTATKLQNYLEDLN